MKIRVPAILAGLAVDLIGSILFVVAIILAAKLIGYRADVILLNRSTVTGPLTMYWVGLVFTFLGAYVTARLSKPNCVLNTFLFGLISTLPAGLVPSDYPRWYVVLCVLTILPLSVAVGYAVRSTHHLTNR